MRIKERATRVAEDSAEAVQRFEGEPDAVYSLEVAAHLTRLTRRAILLYCRHGLISPAADPERDGYYFDTETIWMLRQIACLNAVHGVNLTGTRIILDLMREVERLRTQLLMAKQGRDAPVEAARV